MKESRKEGRECLGRMNLKKEIQSILESDEQLTIIFQRKIESMNIQFAIDN